MTTEGLQAAAQILEDDIRRIDAGEMTASPVHRAFLAGAVKGLRRPDGMESGGFPVDQTGRHDPNDRKAQQGRGMDGGRPQNNGLADTFDGGGPFTEFTDNPPIDGGKA